LHGRIKKKPKIFSSGGVLKPLICFLKKRKITKLRVTFKYYRITINKNFFKNLEIIKAVNKNE
jgi:hypothetical protein